MLYQRVRDSRKGREVELKLFPDYLKL